MLRYQQNNTFQCLFLHHGKIYSFSLCIDTVPVPQKQEWRGTLQNIFRMRCLFLCLSVPFRQFSAGVCKASPLVCYLILLLCAVINYAVGPTSLNRKKEKDAEYIRRTRIQTLVLTAMIAVLIAVMSAVSSQNNHSMITFWTLVLHTLQMAITPKLKEVKYREELG